MVRRKPKINKKVRNATATVYKGINFRSRLEVYCYKQLEAAKIQFRYEENKFILQEGFELENYCLEPLKDKTFGEARKKILPITYTPDFVGETFIIETKGFANDLWPLKYKLFKKYLFNHNFKFDIYLPKNQKQVDQVVQSILDRSNGRKRILQ